LVDDWGLMGSHVYLCGRIAISGAGPGIDERELPGRQGRLALALLCLERRRPVSVDRLVGALWDDDPPPDPAGALASIVSKLRSALRRCCEVGPDVISAAAGTYQLRLPIDCAVDLEDARTAIDRAEGARRRGEPDPAWADATVATSIARRGFLPGETGDWALAVQRELERIARRGYDTLTWVWTTRDDGVLATAMAEHAVEMAPLHEPAWRSLMATHARFGSRADALRAYRRCMEVLGEQLGVLPDVETTELYTQLLAT
jgi:DNA-binding SARP family transcriptional activator